MNITLIIIILLIHYMADFLLQESDIKANKGKSIKALAIHTVLYTMEFFIFMTLAHCLFIDRYIVFGDMFPRLAWLSFCVGATHGGIDGITSRITRWAHENGKTNTFFNVIGFDQWMHYLTIFWLYNEYILR